MIAAMFQEQLEVYVFHEQKLSLGCDSRQRDSALTDTETGNLVDAFA